jgi:hypothetical protein
LISTTDLDKDQWLQNLPIAIFAYNTSIQETLQESPYFILFGREPTFPGPELHLIAPNTFNSTTHYVDVMKNRFKLIVNHVKTQLELVRNKYMKDNLNIKSFPVYSPGDLVWLRIVLKYSNAPSNKLRTKLMGPYKILRKLSNLNYELDMPNQPQESHIVHVIRLVPFKVRTKELIENEEKFNELKSQIMNQPKPEDIMTGETKSTEANDKIDENKMNIESKPIETPKSDNQTETSSNINTNNGSNSITELNNQLNQLIRTRSRFT